MEYIFPNPDEKICIVIKKDKIDGVQCGEVLDKNSSLYREIMKELNFPFHKSVIKLNQCIRNLMKDNSGANVLLLSGNEGGFANCGLRLEDTYYPNLNYVELVIDEERLRDGVLHIFSHELGHVMMHNMFRDFPKGKGTKQHVSMGITDFFMAFDEGWAEHFERLAYDFVDKYREIADSSFSYDKDIIKPWLCEADSEIRINGVFKNLYIYKKAVEYIDELDISIVNKIILEHTSTTFNKHKVKNAQEMLSCEGVIATLFYRINTNKKLQERYEEVEFYNNFLIENLDKDTDVKELFTPLENLMLKNFWVWYNIKDKINGGCAPFIEFIKGWCSYFPNDKDEIIKIFLTTTVGKTIGNDLSDIYEKASYIGMMGDIEGIREELIKYKKGLSDLCKKVQTGEVEIDENLGREVWIENTEVKIPEYFWGSDKLVPLRINLNTASIYDLMSFHNMTSERANKILDKRDRMGFFKVIEDIEELYFSVNVESLEKGNFKISKKQDFKKIYKIK